MKIYFASPLFTQMEYEFNARVALQLRCTYPEIEVYLPQEQTEINDKNGYADAMMIAKADTEALCSSNLLIAVLDGQVIDPGVASEIGVAYHAGIPIIGLFTDVRQHGAQNQQKLEALQTIGESQFPYVNLYTVGLIKLHGTLVNTVPELIELTGDILKL